MAVPQIYIFMQRYDFPLPKIQVPVLTWWLHVSFRHQDKDDCDNNEEEDDESIDDNSLDDDDVDFLTARIAAEWQRNSREQPQQQEQPNNWSCVLGGDDDNKIHQLGPGTGASFY